MLQVLVKTETLNGPNEEIWPKNPQRAQRAQRGNLAKKSPTGPTGKLVVTDVTGFGKN